MARYSITLGIPDTIKANMRRKGQLSIPCKKTLRGIWTANSSNGLAESLSEHHSKDATDKGPPKNPESVDKCTLSERQDRCQQVSGLGERDNSKSFGMRSKKSRAISRLGTSKGSGTERYGKIVFRYLNAHRLLDICKGNAALWQVQYIRFWSWSGWYRHYEKCSSKSVSCVPRAKISRLEKP